MNIINQKIKLNDEHKTIKKITLITILDPKHIIYGRSHHNENIEIELIPRCFLRCKVTIETQETDSFEMHQKFTRKGC